MLGPPAIGANFFTVSFCGWGVFSTKIDYVKKVGTLVLSSLLEDLGYGSG